MKWLSMLCGLSLPVLAWAQVADRFNPDAYVQVEVILFTTEAVEGATNRTGVLGESLELDLPRRFPAGLASIGQARFANDRDVSWFEDEWSLIAPGLLDEMPPEHIEAESVLEEPDLQIEQPPEEPSLWQRYQAWYTALLANCYSQLAPDEWRLAQALASLERSGAHRVLMHGAWIQPISARPRPVLLAGGESGEVGVLSLTRTGFVSADVRFWRPLGHGYAELREVRPMRTRRAYYFDHPLMGLVVRVDPIRVPQEFL